MAKLALQPPKKTSHCSISFELVWCWGAALRSRPWSGLSCDGCGNELYQCTLLTSPYITDFNGYNQQLSNSFLSSFTSSINLLYSTTRQTDKLSSFHVPWQLFQDNAVKFQFSCLVCLSLLQLLFSTPLAWEPCNGLTSCSGCPLFPVLPDTNSRLTMTLYR